MIMSCGSHSILRTFNNCIKPQLVLKCNWLSGVPKELIIEYNTTGTFLVIIVPLVYLDSFGAVFVGEKYTNSQLC